MAVPRPDMREVAERHRREEAQDTRDRRWFWVRVILLCWLWALLGLGCAAFAFHTNDPELGMVFMYAGQLVTLVGVLGTLGWSLAASEKRGWR